MLFQPQQKLFYHLALLEKKKRKTVRGGREGGKEREREREREIFMKWLKKRRGKLVKLKT